jgi:hypothetical protein
MVGTCQCACSLLQSLTFANFVNQYNIDTISINVMLAYAQTETIVGGLMQVFSILGPPLILQPDNDLASETLGAVPPGSRGGTSRAKGGQHGRGVLTHEDVVEVGRSSSK